MRSAFCASSTAQYYVGTLTGETFQENGITSAYWLNLHHFRPDLPYTDVRRLKLPSEAGPAADCALILRYLSNSHVFDFKAPVSDSRFTLRMLAAFVGRNFSVGRLRMCVLDDQLTDYRSINAVFDGGLRLGKLHLRILRKNLAALIKTTDFLRMPTIQELEELKLKLVRFRGFNAGTDSSTRRQNSNCEDHSSRFQAIIAETV